MVKKGYRSLIAAICLGMTFSGTAVPAMAAETEPAAVQTEAATEAPQTETEATGTAAQTEAQAPESETQAAPQTEQAPAQEASAQQTQLKADDGTDDGADDGTDGGTDDGTNDGTDDGTDDGSDDRGGTDINGGQTEKPISYNVGDEYSMDFKDIGAKDLPSDVKKIRVSVTGNNPGKISNGDGYGVWTGVSSPKEEGPGSGDDENLKKTYTMDVTGSDLNGTISIQGTVKNKEDGKIVVTVELLGDMGETIASDSLKGTFTVTDNTSTSKAVIALPESRDAGTFSQGAKIEASVDKFTVQNAAKIRVAVSGTEPASVESAWISAKGGDPKETVKDDGSWTKEYELTPDEGATEVSGSVKFTVDNAKSGKGKLSLTVYATDSEGQETSKTMDTTYTVAQSSEVGIESSAEIVDKGAAFQHTVSVTYGDGEDPSKLPVTVTPDANASIASISAAEGSLFDGASVKVTTDEGTADMTLSGAVDLGSAAGIKSIEIAPKAGSKTGEKGDIVLNMTNETDALSITTAASVDGKTASAVTKMTHAAVQTPTVWQPDKKIPFGSKANVTIGFAGIGADWEGTPGEYNYSISVPSYVTVNEFDVPVLAGAESITVFYTTHEGNEIELGEYAPGDRIQINAAGLTGFRLNVIPDASANAITASAQGAVVFTNDQKENKEKKASMSAKASFVFGSKVISASSEESKFTLSIYKGPDNTQSGGGNGGSGSGGNGGNGGSGSSGGMQEETEDPAKKSKEVQDRTAEENAKAKAAKTTLQKENEAEQKKNALFASRIDEIRASGRTAAASAAASSAAGSSTADASLDAKAKYEAWEIPPIFESMIEDHVPEEFTAIPERIIENTVPEAD